MGYDKTLAVYQKARKFGGENGTGSRNNERYGDGRRSIRRSHKDSFAMDICMNKGGAGIEMGPVNHLWTECSNKVKAISK